MLHTDSFHKPRIAVPLSVCLTVCLSVRPSVHFYPLPDCFSISVLPVCLPAVCLNVARGGKAKIRVIFSVCLSVSVLPVCLPAVCLYVARGGKAKTRVIFSVCLSRSYLSVCLPPAHLWQGYTKTRVIFFICCVPTVGYRGRRNHVPSC